MACSLSLLNLFLLAEHLVAFPPSFSSHLPFPHSHPSLQSFHNHENLSAHILPDQVFINHPSTRERFDRLLPFLPPYNIRFRRGATPPSGSDLTSADMECQQSESSFISWDFWKYGFGRIQVVPGVHACYGKEDAMLRGWLEFPMADEGHSEMIEWQDE